MNKKLPIWVAIGLASLIVPVILGIIYFLDGGFNPDAAIPESHSALGLTIGKLLYVYYPLILIEPIIGKLFPDLLVGIITVFLFIVETFCVGAFFGWFFTRNRKDVNSYK